MHVQKRPSEVVSPALLSRLLHMTPPPPHTHLYKVILELSWRCIQGKWDILLQSFHYLSLTFQLLGVTNRLYFHFEVKDP